MDALTELQALKGEVARGIVRVQAGVERRQGSSQCGLAWIVIFHINYRGDIKINRCEVEYAQRHIGITSRIEEVPQLACEGRLRCKWSLIGSHHRQLDVRLRDGLERYGITQQPGCAGFCHARVAQRQRSVVGGANSAPKGSQAGRRIHTYLVDALPVGPTNRWLWVGYFLQTRGAIDQLLNTTSTGVTRAAQSFPITGMNVVF